METLARRLGGKGVLDPARAARLDEIEDGRLISLHAELRALMYLGALFVVYGSGETVRRHFEQLGHLAVIGLLTVAVGGCLAYCFIKGKPFDHGEVAAPTAAFDYVLFLACALLGVEFAYIEAHFKLLERFWDYYLLVSGALFVGLAYRFDNRLVLALGIVNLGAWIGVRFRELDFLFFSMRGRALAFAGACVWAGVATEAKGLKPHFKDTYLNIGVNVALATALSGPGGFFSPWFVVLAAGVAATAWYAMTTRRFLYLLFAVGYGYVGFSGRLLDVLNLGGANVALYFAVSSVAVAVALFRLRSLLEEKE